MKLVFARGLVISLGLAVQMVGAGANAGTVVTSIFDSQATFEVVTEKEAEGALEPGIYGLSKTTDVSTPLVLGQVLGVSKSFNGIQKQLSTGMETGRNESLAVIDGRLVLFTRNSRPNEPSTVVQIGGPKGISPIDPLTKMQFELSPIQSLADLYVIDKPVNTKQSLVLVSQRQASPMGDGVTFAFITDGPAQRGKSSLLKLAGTPLMINHDFLDAMKLGQLLGTRDYHVQNPPQTVYSHIVLNALGHPRYNDTPTKAKWRSDLLAKIRTLPMSADKEKMVRQTKWVPNALPVLDVLTGLPVLPAYPIQILSQDSPVAIIQREDPVRDVDHVYLYQSNTSEVNNAEATFGKAAARTDGIAGRVNLSVDNRRTPLIFHASVNSEWRPAPELTIQNFESFGPNEDLRVPSLLAKINNQFHLTFKSESGLVATFNIEKLTGIELGSVTRLHYVHYLMPEKGPQFPEHTLVLSYVRDRASRTVALTFRSDGINFIPGRVVSMDKRFQKAEQIEKRILAYKQGLFYDAQSGDREVANLYGNREKVTGIARSPYFDITNKAQLFLRAKEKIELIKGLTWYSFEQFPTLTNDATGVYQLNPDRTDRKGSVRLVASGQMLHRVADLQKDTGDNARLRPLAQLPVAPLTEDDLNLDSDKEVLGGYKVLVYASESMKNATQNSYIIALDQDKIPVSSTNIQVQAPFSQFVEVNIIRHRRGLKNNFTAMFFFRNKGKEKNTGGVYVANFNVRRTAGENYATAPFLVTAGSSGWITRDEIDPGLIKSRVVFDANGAPIWFENPHLDKTDEDFTVVRLDMANQGRSTLEQLTADVNFNETVADSELQKSTLSDWAIYFPDKIAKRRPDLKLSMETKKETKKETEAREKKFAETEATFPNLYQYLDQMVEESTKPRATVLLVEKDMKAQFLEGMFDRFARNRGGQFAFTNDGFNFFMLQQESTPVKYRQEMVNVVRKSGKKLLFVDGKDLISAQQASDADGEEETKEDEAAKKEEQEADDKEEEAEKNGQVVKAFSEEDPEKAGRKPPERFTAPLIRMLAAEGNDKHVTSVDQVADLPHRLPMVVVMTPYEWRRLHEENTEDARAYLDKRFRVDARFLTSGWAVWSPRSSRAKPEIKQIAGAGVSLDAVRVFDQLNTVLMDAVNPEKKPKHQILIYPDELGPLMEKLILGRWASESAAMNTPWNHRNSNLALLRLPKPKDGAKITQQSVFENYGGLKEIRKSKKPVVLAQISDINQIGRPESESGSSTFMLRDPSAGATAGDLKVSNGEDAEVDSGTKSKNPPHLLWMMATEGSKIQPTLSKDWSVRDDAPAETSTIIYGTEGEFSRLKGEVGFESRFGSLIDAFEVIHLQEPPVELRRQLVREIFSRHQLRNLDLTFKVGDSAPRSEPNDLVSILISRIEQQASVANQDPTTAFIRVYSLIQSFVSEDPTLRETRVVDKAAVERLLTFVFPTGLKPASLPPTHPINIVKDTTKAALSWQKTGYRGYADLKRQILEQYFSQTESVQDPGRPVRFSTILFGPTSTGKSYLLQTLFDMLKLRPLDAHNPSFREVDYYFIKVHELTDADGHMSVEKTLLRAEQLLCNNPQAHIVFDDLHKAESSKMLRRIIAWMSAIFDVGTKGMISFRCNESERREVPVMNMGLHITVNPTSDQKMRERVRGKDYLETEILAGLSKDDFILESSFLARVTAKFNMEKFPAGAKFATLINDARKASQSEFISKEALVMVSPLAVQKLVDRFGDANAREFSSNATVALMQISHDLPKSPVYIVDLKNTWKRKLLDKDIGGFDPTGGAFSAIPMGGAEVNRDTVKKAIQEIVTFRAVDGNNAGSMLDFVSFIVDGFRIHAYQTMLDGLMDDEQLNGTRASQQHFIGEMLLATYDSLVEWGTIPLNNLSLHPRDLGWTSEGKIPEFLEALNERSEKQDSDRKFFRYGFTARGASAASDAMDSIEELDKRTLDVLSETSHELREVMLDLMKAYFRVQSVQHLPKTGDWFTALPDLEKKGTAEEPGLSQLRENLYQAGQRMTAIYGKFTGRLFDPELLDHKISNDRVREPLVKMSSYDQARLFLQALDKAVVSLPWGKMSHFAWANMKEATQDSNLGHLPRFQQLLFKSEFSPYGTVTPDSIFQSVSGNPLYKNLTARERKVRRENFDRDCDRLLLSDDNIIPLPPREGEAR